MPGLLAVLVNHQLRPEAAAEIEYTTKWMREHGNKHKDY